ncbi:MAG: YHS domain-containing protein [Steroidobacteraceae bacterium]
MTRFGCGAHVMTHRGKHDASSNESGGAPAISPNQPSQSTDPVCGMSADIARAKSAVHDGHGYYFCSKGCREKFEAGPASYINPETTRALLLKELHGARY